MVKTLKLSVILILFLSGCKVVDEIKKELYVKISTDNVTQVSYSVAVAGGNVIDDGGKAITEKGICFSTTPGPTTSSNKISLGTGMGPFSGVLQKLTDNTTYYYKAYCINALGTAYGEEKSFTTQNASLPTVLTNPATDVKTNQFTISLKVTSDGGSTLIGSGFYYSLNPTISLADKTVSITNSYNVNTVYSATITGLADGTTYYIAAFSRNGKGVQLGNTIAVRTTENPIKAGIFSGLQVFYSFNGNANDESGNGFHGTVTGAKLTSDRLNNANSAYSFDGKNGTRIKTNYFGVLGGESRTISVWAKTSSIGNNTPLLSYGNLNSANTAWGQGCVASFGALYGTPNVFFDNVGSAAGINFNVKDDNWHHYIFTYNKSWGTTATAVKIYIDGKYYPNNVFYNPYTINTVKGVSLVIGEYNADISDFRTFNGLIDDVGIWNRALTDIEIQYLFQNNYKP
jgi:hypothetical protein